MGQIKNGMTRRVFIGQAGKIVASGGICSSLLSCQGTGQGPRSGTEESAAKPSGYGPFKMGFQSYSLRHFSEMDTLLKEAQKLGLSYVELYSGHLSVTSTAAEIEDAKEKLAGVGLTANAFGVEGFSGDHEKNKALFEFGKALGVTNLSADPTKDAFESLEQLVKEYGIRIAIHNHGPEDERWRRPEWILEAVGERDPRIGCCADLGHFIRAGVDPAEAIEMLGARVLGVHLKDFDEQENDVVLGEGRLDLEKALTALKKVSFDGPFSLEYEGDPENPVPKMLESLRRIREIAARI